MSTRTICFGRCCHVLYYDWLFCFPKAVQISAYLWKTKQFTLATRRTWYSYSNVWYVHVKMRFRFLAIIYWRMLLSICIRIYSFGGGGNKGGGFGGGSTSFGGNNAAAGGTPSFGGGGGWVYKFMLCFFWCVKSCFWEYSIEIECIYDWWGEKQQTYQDG